jgi:hypothetical protein
MARYYFNYRRYYFTADGTLFGRCLERTFHALFVTRKIVSVFIGIVTVFYFVRNVEFKMHELQFDSCCFEIIIHHDQKP